MRETGRTSGHVGRTAVTYELVPDAAYIAAVDLGGTKISAGDCRSRLPESLPRKSSPPTGVAGNLSWIRSPKALCAGGGASGHSAGERIRMAVIGAPGAPDANRPAEILLAPNISRFRQR